MTKQTVLQLVERAIQQAGGVVAFARLCGVTSPYISHIRSGYRPPGPKVLARLGLERENVRRYRAA